METLSWFWNVFKVAFGLGFVIFVHELGHFLLAKWNGVKVEKFSIGFGPTLLGFRRGETEYVLAAIPLGGFVKMLGEGPDEEASRSTDPRSFTNKTVGARMAIISAGVVMNVLLGLCCFVFAYGRGMVEIPPRVGGVEAGSPAYEAGLRSGDEIVAVDGRGDLSFSSMTLKVLLSSPGQTLRFEVKRPGQDELLSLEIQPRREPGSERPTIGVRSSSSLNIGLFQPLAGMANPPRYPPLPSSEDRPLIDTLVAVAPPGGEPIPLNDIGDYERVLARFAAEPLVHWIDRRPGPPESPGTPLERFELTIPPVRFLDFGLRLTPEPINGIQKGGVADRAGFRKGDLILRVDGRDDFDPMRLPTFCYERAGTPTTFEVRRTSASGATSEVVLTAIPDATPPWTEPVVSNEALEIPGLGLSFPIRPRVAAVRPDSPAARAGIKPGDVINALTFTLRRLGESSEGEERPDAAGAVRQETIQLGDESPAWVRAFWLIQELPREPVALTVNNASTPVSITPEPVEDWYFPNRGLLFLPLIRKLPPQDIASALRRGWDDTVENILSIYSMFRSLAQRQVGPGSLAGPLRIARFAYNEARSGLTELVHFLGILSINLAVINFLPIPPLDGGQMLFLAAEKIRGKPLPESALSAGILIGILLVIGLMIFVTYQDIFWYIKNWHLL